MDRPPVSLAEFASTFERASGQRPSWVHGDGRSVLDQAALRHRVEEILDTVVALERADWMQDGVHAGPTTLPGIWRAAQHAARTLRVAVPPVVVAGIPARSQGTYGTDSRAFLYLSTFYMDPASEGERRFTAGRFVGHVAAHHVTASTLYALLVDQSGLRSVARKAVGPALEVLLAPMSLGLRLLLSRWHRTAEVSADRAGLLCCGDLVHAGRALLRASLGRTPDLSIEEYLEHLRAHGRSPGRWAELLADQPFTHKRLRALSLYSRSEDYASHGGEVRGEPIARAELDRQTDELLGGRVSDAVLQALESSDDTAGIWLWRSVSAELAGPLRIGIVGRDERLVQRVGAHLPENTSWTPIVVGSEPDPALPVQDRLLPLHAVVFATPSTAPLGASEREWLGHLGALGAPSERVVAIGDLNVLAAMSDAPEQEAREIAARVDALTPRDWRVVDEDTLPAAVIDWRARLDTVARSRRAEVGRVLLGDAVRRASDAVQRAERELAAVDALLGAEDAAIDEAARLGGRTAAHLSSAARRQTEQLQVDLAAFLTALEGDIAAQLDGVQDIDLARRALPHWLHHVVEGWMSDRVARWRADLEAELADLGIAAEDLDRADLVAPALHARIPHATQGWGKRLGVTAAMGGGAALLAFGLWIPGLLAVSGGALFSALGRKAEEAATRRALGEAAVDAIRKMGADADRLLRDQVQGFQATLATLSDERRHTESEARALVRGHLAEEHGHHGRRIDALRVTRDRLRAALDGLTPAGRP